MKTATLGELVENCPANYGGDPGSRDVDALVAKVSNIAGSGEFHREFETRSFTDRELKNLTARPGDLFVVKSSGSKKKILSGKTAIVAEDSPTPLIASNFLLLLRPNTELVEPRYLWRVLNSTRSKAFIKTVVGAFTYPNLKWSTYRKHPIPLPPLAEQKRIAGILDAADVLRTKRRESLAQLDTLLQSTFLDMFGDPVTNPMGWSVEEFGAVGTVITGNTPSRSQPEYYGDHIEWIKSDNINSPSFFLTEAEERLSVVGKKVARSAPEGSILVTCIAGSPSSIGNAAIANREVAFNQQINAFVPGELVNLWFAFGLFWVGKRLVQRASTNSMKGMVSKSAFCAIAVPVPPRPLQDRFADIADSIEQQKASQRAHLDELDTLFASLQSRAFRGDL